jgi:hypothetical protein
VFGQTGFPLNTVRFPLELYPSVFQADCFPASIAFLCSRLAAPTRISTSRSAFPKRHPLQPNHPPTTDEPKWYPNYPAPLTEPKPPRKERKNRKQIKINGKKGYSHDAFQHLLQVLEIRHVPGHRQTRMTRPGLLLVLLVFLLLALTLGLVRFRVCRVGSGFGQDPRPGGRLARLTRMRRRGRVERVQALDVFEPG